MPQAKEVNDKVNYFATALAERFQSPGSKAFYCKVYYSLPSPIIDRLIIEAEEKGKNPGALFNHLARKEMGA